MKVLAAVTRHMFKEFVVVAVKSGTTTFSTQANRVIDGFQPVFPQRPIVLFEFDHFGRGKYFGERSLVNMLSRVDPARLPWKEYWI
jgi:hypothetical protein